MAVNLRFETGTFREYQLNGGETIRVNVSDPAIMTRLRSCQEEIDKIREKLGDDMTPEDFEAVERNIRKIIDDTIDCPGACDKAFGRTSCLAVAGGVPIFVNFIKALSDQLKSDITEFGEETKRQYEALENERTRKYTEMPIAEPDIDNLSEEEKDKLLRELLSK